MDIANLKTSESTDKIFPALVSAWAEIDTAVKDASNPFFNSVYADLPSVMGAIKPHFVKNNLAMLQPASRLDSQVLISTIIVHSSGQWIASDFAISAVDSKPQSIGSAITYARRYAASSITGVVSDKDDDGNAASGTQNKTQPQPTQRPLPKPENKQAPKDTEAKNPMHLATTLRTQIFGILKGTDAENDDNLKKYYKGVFGVERDLPNNADMYVKPLADLLRLIQKAETLADFKTDPKRYGADWKSTNAAATA